MTKDTALGLFKKFTRMNEKNGTLLEMVKQILRL
jgi:hypothetical protein